MIKTHYIQQPDSGKTHNLVKEARKDDLVIIPWANHPNTYYDFLERNKDLKLPVIQVNTRPDMREYIGGKYKESIGKRMLIDDFLHFDAKQVAFVWQLAKNYNVTEVIAWSTPKLAFSKEVFVAAKTLKYWDEAELGGWLTPSALRHLKAKCQELQDYMLIDAAVTKAFKIMSGEEQKKMYENLGQEQYDLLYRLRIFE